MLRFIYAYRQGSKYRKLEDELWAGQHMPEGDKERLVYFDKYEKVFMNLCEIGRESRQFGVLERIAFEYGKGVSGHKKTSS